MGESASLRTCGGPNALMSTSARPLKYGLSVLARTSLVLPILRLSTRPADSARSISRWTELTGILN